MARPHPQRARQVPHLRAEHDIPRRARAYLVTDQAVTATVTRHASTRPVLDEISQHGLDARRDPDRADSPDRRATPDYQDSADSGPEPILWAALSLAPTDGVTVPELVDQTGMSRPWIYQRLRDLVRDGQAAQVTRGRWRAARSNSP